MALFIGIDGGGSKTKCVLCDESLNVKFELISGPSNFLTIGTKPVAETIVKLVIDCCENTKINSSDISNIVLGTTGAGRTNDANNLRNEILDKFNSKNIDINSLQIVSDARIALEGAFTGNIGSILISGTGSIMFGKDDNSDIHRVGGFGRILGDEGSGYTIGRKGLNLISKSYDSREKDSLLTKKFISQFNILDGNSLIYEVYSNDFKIQNITPLVIESAAEGDEKCVNILDEESNELLLHIMAMRKKLNTDLMKLVFIGGTIANDNYYSQMLKNKINSFLPEIIIQEPDYPPEIGAVILGMQN